MEIRLKNIGMIKEADVKLNGLTIIAGENDTGKSTVGKMIFSIIKAINRYEEDLEESKDNRVSGILDEIYISIRNIDRRNDLSFRKYFEPFELRKLILKYISNNDLESVESLIKDKLEQINLIPLSIVSRNELVELFDKLRKIIFIQEPKHITIKRALQKALNSEFFMEIANKFSKEFSKVEYLDDNQNEILNFTGLDNRINEMNYLKETFLQDVTFVESPIILQLHDSLKYSRTRLNLGEKRLGALNYRNPGYIILHIKDLMNKIEWARYTDNNESDEFYFGSEDKEDSISYRISKVITGDLVFSKKDRDFFYIKQNDVNEQKRFRSANTASGIKAFGIIQLLLKAEFLNPRSLLVIDEPETHLHPEWQLKYAKMLIELVKLNIPILVTSHSPYMIQALRKLVEDESLEHLSNFYLAKKSENSSSVIQNVNDDIDSILHQLAEPFQKLVWR